MAVARNSRTVVAYLEQKVNIMACTNYVAVLHTICNLCSLQVALCCLSNRVPMHTPLCYNIYKLRCAMFCDLSINLTNLTIAVIDK